MRAVIQRTIRSSVTSEGTETGRIGEGLTVLLGVGRDDDEKDVVYTADKILNLRIFEDEEGKMNQSLLQKSGECWSFPNLPCTEMYVTDAGRVLRQRHLRIRRTGYMKSLYSTWKNRAFVWRREFFRRKWSSLWITTVPLRFC